MKPFTDIELEMIQEMIDSPEAYRLTSFGLTCIKGIQKKMQEINQQNEE